MDSLVWFLRNAKVRDQSQSKQNASCKTTDGDDDTSGEETIESRVARIKARVAELTGNMEGTTSPAPNVLTYASR
ncbi:hypothetical protein HYQ46_009960 [Verticillium longisporum]|nr:hypothetical protein HYQ46_009960 [Verticillium longisporum]